MRQNLELITQIKPSLFEWSSRVGYRKRFGLSSIWFSEILILYLLLYGLDKSIPGIVSREISINYLLIPLLVLGIVTSLFPKEDENLIEELNLSKLGYMYKKITFRKSYYFVGIFVLILGLIGIIWPRKNVNMRYAADKYHVVLVNRGEKSEYTKSYKQLLENKGYKNVSVSLGDNYPETTSKATVMYGAKDNLAGEQVAQLLALSYPEVQRSPLLESTPQKIVVILK